jgi:hypothetical protein
MLAVNANTSAPPLAHATWWLGFRSTIGFFAATARRAKIKAAPTRL